MENLIESKSFQFAVQIVKLCRDLQNSQKEYILSKQLLRSGTSIGANVAESQQAQSRADFVSKLNIALKESVETIYWLRLLHASGYLSDMVFLPAYQEATEIKRILIAIVKSTKT